jgi:PAS domain S-box-containing protein
MNEQATDELRARIDELQSQLTEAQDTIEAIRTGQIDALVVNGHEGHTLYTLKSADLAYRVFVEQMNEGALTLNPEGLVLYSNSKFSAMVRKPLSEVIGKPLRDFVETKDQVHFEMLFQRGWEENLNSELCIVSGSSVIPVQVSVNVLQLDNETALSMIVTDLTLQKKNESELKLKNDQLKILNEALISSNHDLQQFASVASHDLQEPLRKIQVFSKFLKDRSFAELSDASRQYVEKIITNSERMKVLILDILTYARLSAKENYLEPIDLTLLIKDILEDFDLKIEEKNATIELGELCVVEGNKGQLRQVFNNLISNALKFTDPGKNPFVAIQKKPFDAKEFGIPKENSIQYCRISVQDHGIGFEEAFTSSIFSLFEKLNPKNTFEGSGIGLAIAKKIIEKHHGFVIAKSIVGQGSEFNVILPIRQPDLK